jgi:hypothetical protein
VRPTPVAGETPSQVRAPPARHTDRDASAPQGLPRAQGELIEDCEFSMRTSRRAQALSYPGRSLPARARAVSLLKDHQPAPSLVSGIRTPKIPLLPQGEKRARGQGAKAHWNAENHSSCAALEWTNALERSIITIGWGEALILFFIPAFLLALAFRSGYVCGRLRRSGTSRKKDQTSLTDDVQSGRYAKESAFPT